ncbi:MAG: hypothetical protein COZ34_00955 [Candidatus Pacebacteria bacterium CG_4_10_14_3_um_filter_34_15]|nr:hypothetical protein [Candidatus Pacearchaeota archaeon]NCQ65231.1 hypothetical protein [Candidatus Paceibacterota bacterium]OIO45042.1 MAG: hypothetical protein AUJ41_01250 [Candidatus Pacebacteria bacterium CG1_02_43_31]PIQ81010.1 MAG: hypothetical protein COV78_02310 [Candidatus Pacebacteria bacterium CG11_big_fil_rev_8_21_14_0_20_34_55]PIX81827.1 MAG: hypothetical protein COZ34_00955 [Candidatus Pacebacteria bacterium CG_4_10_14_3_um_filter_34_15]PJC44043.1 MAG: hypothetical protein CO0
MDILPIVFAVVLVVLTIVLSVVGVQVIMVLVEIKRTLRKVNATLDVVEDKMHAITSPFQNLGGALSGIKTGMQFFEAFTVWLSKGKKKDE